MKTYRRHYCTRRHRSYRTAAKCVWPRAAWVTGEGAYASVSYCRVLTVQLHRAQADAEAAKAFIDRYACGGGCGRRHEIVFLLDPAQMEAA